MISAIVVVGQLIWMLINQSGPSGEADGASCENVARGFFFAGI